MTETNDLDRLLGSYLETGPSRAPERPVDAAVAFARAHPRRRDPLLVLRPDVMAGRAMPFSPQLAWALLVLSLTLAAVAAVAVGSRPDERPVVPPPVVSPAPSPSPLSVSVDVEDSNGGTRRVDVTDLSATLVDVEAGPEADGGPVDDIAATNDPADPNRVWITWSYDSCADPVELTIDATGQILRMEKPVCDGDAIGGTDLRITLVFREPVDAGGLDVALAERP